MIRVVDGDNYFRRRLEADPSGLVLRNLLLEVENSPDVEVWVWDGFGGLKRRRAIYPAYKMKRPKVSEDIYKTRELFQAALLHTKAIQVRVPEYEGDDVVAALAGTYPGPIKIQSNDKDLLQLEMIDGVKVDRPAIPGVDASEVRLWKTLVGDQSDNITGIKGFGEKAWQNCNRDAFRYLLEDLAKGGIPRTIDDTMEEFQIPGICARWLMEHEPELRAMWQIIGFFPVPWDQVTNNMVAGQSDPAAADKLLKDYLQ